MSPLTLISQLIGYSLFGGSNPISALSTPLSAYDWQSIFEESRKQAVTALLYDAILLLPKEHRPPRSVLFHFVSMTRTIERDNILREQALSDFNNKVMQPLGIPTVVVKGSSLAALYPQPLHRECGDNDLYTGADTKRLAQHLESIGIHVDRKNPRHISFRYQNVDFEAHNYLLYHNTSENSSRASDPIWLTEQYNSSHPNSSLLTSHFSLLNYQSALFLAKHIEYHAVFFHNPVHLRDLIDWSLLLASPDFDFHRFRTFKKDTDVDHFAELMSSYCNALFGLHIHCQLPKGLETHDFDKLYMQCPQRHPLALVRVARRSSKYICYHRKYRTLYGQSPFRRFYLKNILIAIRNIFLPKAK